MDENEEKQIVEIKAEMKKRLKSFLLNAIWMTPLAFALNCIFGQDNVFRWTLLSFLMLMSIFFLKNSITEFIEKKDKWQIVIMAFGVFMTYSIGKVMMQLAGYLDVDIIVK